MAQTKVSWADHSWNPVTGCTPISAGCQNCYARRMAQRLAGRYGYPADEPFRVTLHPERLAEPARWGEPQRVFVCSMSDLFHDRVPSSFVEDTFAVMERQWLHTYQVLTKRPMRMHDFMIWWCGQGHVANHVWLGVSVENQAAADERIPLLLQTPAVIRFVSYEPALGPVYLARWLSRDCEDCDGTGEDYDATGELCEVCESCHGAKRFHGIDWVIAGSETGPGARPCDLDWLRSVRDQCQAAQVPLWVKQTGTRPERDVLLDGMEWRQLPEVAR